jgi:hypothetical protein
MGGQQTLLSEPPGPGKYCRDFGALKIEVDAAAVAAAEAAKVAAAEAAKVAAAAPK